MKGVDCDAEADLEGQQINRRRSAFYNLFMKFNLVLETLWDDISSVVDFATLSDPLANLASTDSLKVDVVSH